MLSFNLSLSPHWGSMGCLCSQKNEENVEGRCVQSLISCRESDKYIRTYVRTYVGCNWLYHVTGCMVNGSNAQAALIFIVLLTGLLRRAN